MGLDLEAISDTPEFIQDFLEEILIDCLNGVPEDTVVERVREYKKEFRMLDPWKKGMPKSGKQHDYVYCKGATAI